MVERVKLYVLGVAVAGFTGLMLIDSGLEPDTFKKKKI